MSDSKSNTCKPAPMSLNELPKAVSFNLVKHGADGWAIAVNNLCSPDDGLRVTQVDTFGEAVSYIIEAMHHYAEHHATGGDNNVSFVQIDSAPNTTH